jgi:hypothetical protein
MPAPRSFLYRKDIMTPQHPIAEFLERNPAPQVREWLSNILNRPKPEVRTLPTMPSSNFEKRDSLMELRPRHLCWVEEIGIREHYDRSVMQNYMEANYNRMFGPLRPKARATPMDAFYKKLMIFRLLDLIELRREEIAANVLPGGLHRE